MAVLLLPTVRRSFTQNPLTGQKLETEWMAGGNGPIKERIFIELMTSNRNLKASREGSKERNYGT